MRPTLAYKTSTCLAIALASLGGLCMTALTSSDAMASTGGASGPIQADAPSRVGAAAVTTSARKLARVSKSSQSRRHSAGEVREGEQIATWFGPGFYGQKTACGQTMTPVIVGVASRTLPCGTLVQVSYGGRKLTVPVIDRGPYAHNGATWDLTWGAASALSIEDTVRVATKIVGQAPNTPLLGVPAEVKPAASSATVAPSGGTVAG